MSLLSVTASDQYTDATTLRCPGGVRLIITVSNQPVRYQLGRGFPGGQVHWDNEERLMMPALASLERRCDAIRFRNHVAGQAAIVSCDAITAGELPDPAQADG